MKSSSPQNEWQAYLEKELESITPILTKHGYTLDEEQPHTKGERYLMQAATTTSGRKLILIGKQLESNKRVVIKVTDDLDGIREIEHERKCRALLHKINFAYDVFFSPEEIAHIVEDPYTISIQSFIEQNSTFLERSLEDQFKYALRGFKAQESAQATTHNHLKLIGSVFESRDAKDYIRTFIAFKDEIIAIHHDNTALTNLLLIVEKELSEKSKTIEQYCGFLTHVDFVPHNFRIQDDTIYLLDYSSLRFGNKHEGWARFINFMTLYNPGLESALEKYIADNRSKEEVESLQLMRLYRLTELIWYYTNTLKKSEGDLLTLNTARITFWTNVLSAVVEKKKVSSEIIQEYKRTRDSLRSPEEKERQKDLH